MNKPKKAICALLLGREGSISFPAKNTFPVLGRPLMRYPMLAAEHSNMVSHLFFSTNADSYKEIGRRYNWRIIDRPPELATPQALGEHAFQHGYLAIRDELAKKEIEVALLVLLFCNAPTILTETINRGIELLKRNPDIDSAVTVSCYNMWSPLRARKEDEKGLLVPFVPFEVLGNINELNCDRDSQGDVWFADMSVSIVRPHCLENLDDGLLPQRWMGRRIAPIKQWGGLDVDYKWQIPLVEYWLKAHGFTESKTPYDGGSL